MARGRGKRRENGGSRQRPLGLALAIFALLCQSFVLLLLQLALAPPADASPFDGGYVLCHAEDDGGGATPAPAPDKAPIHHGIDCALCQAIHAAGGLVPPALPVLPVPAGRAIAAVPAAAAVPVRHLAGIAHQPRAPPSVLSL